MEEIDYINKKSSRVPTFREKRCNFYICKMTMLPSMFIRIAIIRRQEQACTKLLKRLKHCRVLHLKGMT